MEIETLYSTEMTGVYSGGYVYEYAEDGRGYGLVDISGTSVIETPDFGYLQSQYGETTNPTGGGGYNSNGGASTCPSMSTNWPLSSDALPAIPALAEDYMATGAGPGVGLSGSGSQGKGAESIGTATAGSGNVRPSATSTSAVTSSTASSSGSQTSAASTQKAKTTSISGRVIAGIAVAAVAAVAAILALVLVFIARRKGWWCWKNRRGLSLLPYSGGAFREHQTRHHTHAQHHAEPNIPMNRIDSVSVSTPIRENPVARPSAVRQGSGRPQGDPYESGDSDVDQALDRLAAIAQQSHRSHGDL